jgi:hypothetical protein
MPKQDQVCLPDIQQLEDTTDRDSARFKARELLREVLPHDAWREFVEKGFFHCYGKSGVYRICRQSQTEIYRNGRLYAYACLQLTIPAPSYDRMLAEYLIINNDETLYWSKANIFPARRKLFDVLTILVAAFDLALLLKLIIDYAA